MHSKERPLIALVLAGRRAGGDALESATVIHKAFIEINGVNMITRVLGAIADAGITSDTWIAAPDDIKKQLSALTVPGLGLRIIPSGGSPSLSIYEAISAAPPGAEFLVTTCDHPLLTPEMITHFLNAIDRKQCDIAAACVTRETYEAAYPGTARTFVRFSDFSFSGANLFWLNPETVKPLIQFWRRLENNRKRPLKMAAEIGIVTGALYLLGLLSKKAAFASIAAKTGVNADLIQLPFAEAAIDVDKPKDIETVKRALNMRETPTTP